MFQMLDRIRFRFNSYDKVIILSKLISLLQLIEEWEGEHMEDEVDE
jgi:hypothetical protein